MSDVRTNVLPSFLRPFLRSLLALFAVLALLVPSVARAVTFSPAKGGFSFEVGLPDEPVCVTWPKAQHDPAQCAALGLASIAPPDEQEAHDALVGVGLVHRENLPFTAIGSSLPRRFRVLTAGALPRDQKAIQELAASALPSDGEIHWESPGGEEVFQKLDRHGVPVYRVVAVQNGMAYVMFIFEHSKGTGLLQVLGPRTLYPNVRSVSEEVLASLQIEPPPKSDLGNLPNAESRARYAPWILAACVLALIGTLRAFFVDKKKRGALALDAAMAKSQARSALAAHGAVLLVLAALAVTAVSDWVIFGEQTVTWLVRLEGFLEIASVALAVFTLATWRIHRRNSHAWLAFASVIIAALLFGLARADSSADVASRLGPGSQVC